VCQRKGQDNQPCVSMETPPQGKGPREEKASTSLPVRTWETALFFFFVVGLIPSPSLPGVHHGNLPCNKRHTAAAAGMGGAVGNGNGTNHLSPDWMWAWAQA
jgi:hypothetical protein